MKKIKIIAISVLGMFLAFFLWISISPLVDGKPDFCDNPSIDYIRENAEDSWYKGDYFKGVSEFLRVGWIKSDCRFRIALSRPFYNRTALLENQGRLKEAIAICMTGARIVGQYDPEGIFMYHCDELNMRYILSSPESTIPPVTPTIEP